MSRSRAGCPDEGPIFVVGLHRSGSTLIEQILASHPLVEGTAELAIIMIRDRSRAPAASAGAAIAELQPAQFPEIGAEYLERTRPFRKTDRPYFVDKMPGNWMNLPLIRVALPNARSSTRGATRWRAVFPTSNRITRTAWATRTPKKDRRLLSRLLALHAPFDAVQPGAVHRVLNERLIEDPEAEIRAARFLGLPFDPACLESHKNTRAIRTPSAEQVRKPINREGVEYWRHYEPWLGRTHAALGPALEGWDLTAKKRGETIARPAPTLRLN